MILALNTSTLQFSIAVMAEDGGLAAEHIMSGSKGHYGLLMPTLHRLMDACGVGFRDLTAIAVATGPGSFTGLRVGLAAAKGLSHALEAPLIGVPSLPALASQIACASLPVCALLDSRKEEFFCATFYRQGDRFAPTGETKAMELGAFSASFPEATLFVGNDYARQAPLLRGVLGARAVLAPSSAWCLRASSVGFVALDRLKSREFDAPESLDPIYLRPPDIRPNPYPHHPLRKDDVKAP
jgi:tRNA threonylcarbamoyladenosine biosynthesis protein TsaB